MPDYHVLYLTGPPATGKSTVSRFLGQLLAPVAVFEYGERLTGLLASRYAELTQAEVRTLSADIATSSDIRALDSELLDFIEENRGSRHVVLDSHAVTKESYGYRVVPFPVDSLARLQPSMIVVLYSSADIVVERIARDAAGRAPVTPWEADFHTYLQAQVAVSYAVATGAPLHLVDVACGSELAARTIVQRLGD